MTGEEKSVPTQRDSIINCSNCSFFVGRLFSDAARCSSGKRATASQNRPGTVTARRCSLCLQAPLEGSAGDPAEKVETPEESGAGTSIASCAVMCCAVCCVYCAASITAAARAHRSLTATTTVITTTSAPNATTTITTAAVDYSLLLKVIWLPTPATAHR